MKYLPLNEPCLKWEINFDSYRFLIENHIARVARDFSTLFAQPDLISSSLKQAWLKLEPERQISLLLEPDAAEIIMTAPNTLIHQLEDLMAAVLKRASNDNDIDKGSDYQHPRPLHWVATDDGIYTFNGIRIDVNGMLHHLGNPKIVAPPAEKIEFYVEQINRALKIIGEVSPQALSLIENFTNTIHLRENPQHPGFSSWSTHIGVGKITASNFHYVADDLAEIIDFLIHESIHGFLHLVEEHYGPFLEPQAYSAAWIQEKVVPSPWSGKKIDLGSYTHAIAVWYGLAQFWLKARVTTEHELKPAVVDQMIQQASYGFLKERNVHLAAEERFLYLNKDYLSFSLGFQPEIAKQLRENAIA